jgi:pimeloyl-ACP methyl ester carboxylesterase
MGGGYGLELAATHPERVLGAVFVGPSVDLDEPEPPPDDAFLSLPDDLDADDGWARYNGAYWRREWPAFARWFFGRVFSEPHSTKPIDDGVAWALETDPETMIRIHEAPYQALPDGPAWAGETVAAVAFARRITCPTLVIHGDDDRLTNLRVGRRLAELLGGRLAILRGAGHAPISRDPVAVNLLLRDFVDGLGRRP